MQSAKNIFGESLCAICLAPLGDDQISRHGVHKTCNEALFHVNGRTYPEHDKLKGEQEARDTISRFLDWLPDQKLEIASWDGDELNPTMMNYHDIIGSFLSVDPVILEEEKDDMMRIMRLRYKYPL